MVVDYADRLHEGVDDRRPAKLEALLFQLLRDFLRQRRFGGNLLAPAKAVVDGLAVGEVPEKLREVPCPAFLRMGWFVRFGGIFPKNL